MKRLLLIVLASLALATPAHAYNHVNACMASLRGIYSDNDIHTFGTRIGAKSFGGWGVSWHNARGEAFVQGLFSYWYGGGGTWYTGHCWGGDYGPDSF
jgi:hypothetical protein